MPSFGKKYLQLLQSWSIIFQINRLPWVIETWFLEFFNKNFTLVCYQSELDKQMSTRHSVMLRIWSCAHEYSNGEKSENLWFPYYKYHFTNQFAELKQKSGNTFQRATGANRLKPSTGNPSSLSITLRTIFCTPFNLLKCEIINWAE